VALGALAARGRGIRAEALNDRARGDHRTPVQAVPGGPSTCILHTAVTDTCRICLAY
jgi:hypothetical protein